MISFIHCFLSRLALVFQEKKENREQATRLTREFLYDLIGLVFRSKSRVQFFFNFFEIATVFLVYSFRDALLIFKDLKYQLLKQTESKFPFFNFHKEKRLHIYNKKISFGDALLIFKDLNYYIYIFEIQTKKSLLCFRLFVINVNKEVQVKSKQIFFV